MTANAGGGDWLDLPTTPIQHRGARKPEGLPWDRINEAYVASGGQVDAGVWPKHGGKVQVVGNRAMRHGIHTFVEGEGGDRDNTLAQGSPRRPLGRPLLSEADQRKVALRYRKGESVRALGESLGVSVSAIQTALRHAGEPIRSRGEAQRARAERES